MGRGRSNYSVCLCLCVAALAATGGEARGYYGSKIGGLETLQHGVRGQVYAVDSRTIHIQGFSYDGNAPDAFFYGGSSPRPGEDGFIIPDEDGGMQPLGRYINKDVTLTLPKGKTLQDVRWISVWCRAFAIDFGHVIVDKNLDYPRPQKIEAFTKLDHGVSSDRIVVVDAQTFLIPSFTYDGTAPDGHFWVGKGSPDTSGTVVPDENGSEEPLKKYLDKTIVITLPGDLTVFDIDYLSVWCRAFLANFGYVSIPKSLNVPPSLKMLGVAPQSSGYSYQPPSPARPALSYKPQTTYQNPTTYRPPAYPGLSYGVTKTKPTSLSVSYPFSQFVTSRPSYAPPTTTSRPHYQRPTTETSIKTTSTRRPYYVRATTARRPLKAPTTRHFYKPPTTTRRPYVPSPTTRRPPYRPPHFTTVAHSSRASHGHTTDDLTQSARGKSLPSSRAFSQKTSRSPPPLRSSNTATTHFGVPLHTLGRAASKPGIQSGTTSSSQTFGRSATGISSFNYSNGGSSTSFNIFG